MTTEAPAWPCEWSSFAIERGLKDIQCCGELVSASRHRNVPLPIGRGVVRKYALCPEHYREVRRMMSGEDA